MILPFDGISLFGLHISKQGNFDAKNMSTFFEKSLIWLSGADIKVLSKCSNSEKTKYIGLGSLIIIPALLGMFSMTYAISTIVESIYLAIFFGVLWGGIVLLIDRFIVSTFTKGNRLVYDIFSVSFIMRFVFAIGIGVVVSHPLVMRIFQETIDEQLFAQKEQLSNMILEKTIDKKGVFIDKIENKEARLECLEKLLTSEQSGVKVELDCGYSSGIVSFGVRSSEIKSQILILRKDIELLKKSNLLAVANLDSMERAELDLLERSYSTDYLARVKALSVIEKKHNEVKWVRIFLISFFIFVDVLPVIFKVVLPRSQYDLFKEEDDRIRKDVLYLKTSNSALYKKIIKENEPSYAQEIREEYLQTPSSEANISKLKNHTKAKPNSPNQVQENKQILELSDVKKRPNFSLKLSAIDQILLNIKNGKFKEVINEFYYLLEINQLGGEQDDLLILASKIKFLEEQLITGGIDRDLAKRDLDESIGFLEMLIIDVAKSNKLKKIPNHQVKIIVDSENS